MPKFIPRAGTDHFVTMILRVPTYGREDQDLPLAARIKHELKISVHSKAEAWLIDDGKQGGYMVEIPETTDDGMIIS